MKGATLLEQAPPLPSRAEYRQRRKAFAERIGERAVAILPAAAERTRSRDTHYPFRQDSDFRYLTGFPEADAIAVFAPGRDEGEFVLFVRPRDAAREIWDGRRHGPEGAREHFDADQAWALEHFDAELPKLLADRDVVYLQLGEHVDLDARVTRCVQRLREMSRRGPAAPGCYRGLDDCLHEQRLIKSDAELALMRHAARVSAQAHIAAMQAARPGVYEWQLAAEIHSVFARHDMDPGYGSIVGGGANACILHYVENRARIDDGALVLIDAGGEYRGYTADVTRSWPVSGRFSAEQRAVYDVVLAAQQAAIDTVRAGVAVEDMHTAATKVLTQGMVDLGLLDGDVDGLIEQGAQRRYFMHGTGHWLGMDVHDVGRYRIGDASRAFAPGMVTTVEPGLYIAPEDEDAPEALRGIGIRIEDDVLVTDAAPEVLSADVPTDAEQLQALIGQMASS